MKNKEPLDKKIRNSKKGQHKIIYDCFEESDVKSSLSNLKKRLKEEIPQINNKEKYGWNHDIINKIFLEVIGTGLLEDEK
jgi:hypothetical protein